MAVGAWFLALLSLFHFTPFAAAAQGSKAVREEGEFRILFNGREIGIERYLIVSTGEAASSSSVVEFRNPADSRQKLRFETKLEMGADYRPRTYEFRSDVDGKKGAISGTFPPNEAIFEYRGAETSRKSGVLAGDRFTLLDANIFHHFVFLARLFDYGSAEKAQKFEVVIPQESDSGILKITRLKKESIALRGKKLQANLLQIDSGALQIQLWVDDRRVVHRIAVKDKGLEVVRGS